MYEMPTVPEGTICAHSNRMNGGDQLLKLTGLQKTNGETSQVSMEGLGWGGGYLLGARLKMSVDCGCKILLPHPLKGEYLLVPLSALSNYSTCIYQLQHSRYSLRVPPPPPVMCPPPMPGWSPHTGGLHHTMVALKLQQLRDFWTGSNLCSVHAVIQ